MSSITKEQKEELLKSTDELYKIGIIMDLERLVTRGNLNTKERQLIDETISLLTKLS